MRSLGLSAALIGCVAICLGGAGTTAPSAGTEEAGAGDIPVRTDPVLKEAARDLKLDIWINPDLPKDEKPELVWVRSVWGNDEKNFYMNWEKKQDWAKNEPEWWFMWADVARYKGKLVVACVEGDRPHNGHDSVQHILVSEDDGKTWTTAAHYEIASPKKASPRTYSDGITAFTCGYLTHTPDGRLMMSGRRGHMTPFWHATAFSADGLAWTALKKWTWEGIPPEKWSHNLETFRPAWGPDGKCYGGTRGSQVWRSKDADGLVWEQIKVEAADKGRPAGNETAAAFVKDRLFLFLRSGQVSSSKPPYTHWDINKTNVKGPHSHGGPNIKALPDGEVVAGSRVGQGGKNAGIFKYDGTTLIPAVRIPAGGMATGYPGIAWDDGHLWMAFTIDNDKGKTKEERTRGLTCVAKFKWPLKPGAKSVADIYDQREPAAGKEVPK